MRKPTKVLLHNDRTHDLADKLKERFPTIEIGECNTYENLPDVITTFEPDVVYAIRFAGSDRSPVAAFFARRDVCCSQILRLTTPLVDSDSQRRGVSCIIGSLQFRTSELRSPSTIVVKKIPQLSHLLPRLPRALLHFRRFSTLSRNLESTHGHNNFAPHRCFLLR